ncbi:transposase [Roseicella aerolata]|uniref:Transposase n=1 Tax=Roseicella aerolata TaxID=2883479 RepID=A0A9X1II82_9PROT|nr:transposase [Roseicella aerolata]MCB4823535.1 transposase [Roseicella aerolata]
MSRRSPPAPRPAEPRPWAPLTDAEWDILAPFFARRGAGRPIRDLRHRVDSIFQAVTSGLPWSELRSGTLLWDTAHRQFRRWAHADLWTRLLKAVARRRCGRVLRGLRPWICAAYRRAWRLLGLRGIAIARRLGLFDALRAPPWMLPDPDLSEQALRHLHQRLAPGQPPMARETWRLWLKVLRRLILPTRIPRALAWP